MKKVSENGFAVYHSHRAEPYFTFVKKGQKTIEGRIKKGYYKFIKPGGHIVIYNEEETDSVEVIVKEVRDYRTFRELLENEAIAEVLPNVKTVDEGIEVYRKFYTTEQEKEFGVVALKVKRV